MTDEPRRFGAGACAPAGPRSAPTSSGLDVANGRREASGSDERRLLWVAVGTLAALAAPIAAVAWLLAGPNGALSAMIGLGLVLLLFGASAAALAWVAANRGGAGIGVLAGGALLRLPLYLLVLFALSGVSWVHGRSLAAATAIAVAVTLGTELRMLARTPRLFWVDAAAARSTAPDFDTRS
ncbi:MAG: hypothetical protein R6V28_15190 [Nitriliruptoraceae bacterium]